MTVRRNPKAPIDPDLSLHRFYTVIDEQVDVMGDDPWIKIELPDGRQIDRPRFMFGRILYEP